MPTLRFEEFDKEVNLATRERAHWVVGRAMDADLRIDDPGISRYHATFFRLENYIYVLDHSFNGTHLCVGGEEPSSATKLPGISLDMRKSDVVGNKNSSSKHAADTAEIPAFVDSAPAEDDDGDSEYPSLHKSHALWKIEELSSRLPRIIGYEEHAMQMPEDMQPLLKAIYSAEEAQNLAGLARKLKAGVRIIFIGEDRHYMTFEE